MATIWVDGCKGDGSAANPFRTVKDAVKVAGREDVIVLRGAHAPHKACECRHLPAGVALPMMLVGVAIMALAARELYALRVRRPGP